jgi:uncharacterized membrane protein YdjX (TVP38/TMEM64 family)
MKEKTPAGQYNNKARFGLFGIIVLLLAASGMFFQIDIGRLQASLAKFPVLAAGFIFISLYVVVTFFIWFSKDVFRITAALLFGPVLSTIFVFIAELINAFVLFKFSRILGRGFVEERLKGNSRNLDERLARANLLWLFLFRTVPLIPLRFMDLAAGLTRISLRKYIIVAALGSPLRIFWLQYVLAAVGRGVLTRPEAVANYLMSNRPAFIFTLAYLVLVIAVLIKLKLKDN